VLELRQCWNACSKTEKDTFDFDPWKSELEEFLTLTMNHGFCMDLHHAQCSTTCTCMKELQDTLTDQDRDNIIAYLVLYARLEWKKCAKSHRSTVKFEH
jgi:hypothetical protein